MVLSAPPFANPHDRKFSFATLEQYSPILDQRRKISINGIIQQTAQGLSNTFACDEASPEDLIFNLFKIPNKDEASIGKLLMVLKNYGLQEEDPRLLPMMRKIREIEREREELMNETKDPKHWKLRTEDFMKCIGESLALISQTLQNDLVIPSWSQFTVRIKNIYEKVYFAYDQV
jgi:hypothetical protein